MENPSRLSILEDLMKSQENLIKKNQITDQKIDKIALAFDELSKLVIAQSQNKPVQTINTGEIERSLSNQLKVSLNPVIDSFNGVSAKIDSIPKKIDVGINWISIFMKGWKMYSLLIIICFMMAIAGSSVLLTELFERSQRINYYKGQIEKLKNKNPETAKKYFPNE